MANNKVNFFIEFKQKGLEFVKKYKNEIKDLGKFANSTSKTNKTFNKSLDDSAKSTNKVTKNVKELNKELEKSKKASSNFGRNIGLAIGAATTAATLYSKKIIETIDAESKLSRKAGVDFEEFQVYGRLAELAGVSVDTLTNSFFELNKTVQEAAIGEGEGFKFIKALGIDAKELAKLDPGKQIKIIAESIKDLPELEQKLVLDKLKIKDVELFINELKNYDSLNQKLKNDGLILSEDDAKRFEEFNDQIAVMFQNLKSFSAIFISELMPALNEFLKSQGDGTTLLNGENAKTLATDLVKVISILKLFTSTISVAKEGLQNLTEPVVKLIFLLTNEMQGALEKFKNNFDLYAKLINTGEWTKMFIELNKKVIDFEKYYSESLISMGTISALFLKNSGFDKAADLIGLQVAKQVNELERLNKIQKELNLNNTDEINLTQEKNRLIDERVKNEKKAIKKIYKARQEAADKELLDATEVLKNSTDFINKFFSGNINNKKEIEDKAKEDADQYKKSLADELDKLNKLELTETEKSSGRGYENLLSSLNKEFELVELKFKLDPTSKDEYIRNINQIYDEIEETVKLFGTENELLKVQYERQLKIKEITNDTLRTESLKKEILSAQLSLMNEFGDKAEANDIERAERIKEIEEEFIGLEEKATLIDLTNKIFDIEKFKINLEKAEEELDQLNNKLNNTDFFNFEERNNLEQQINNKTAERIELQNKLGIKQEENNENYIFTVQRINQLNEQLKDSFIDIFSDFAAGSKSAKEAFNDFATFFLKKISEMILEQLYLNTIGSLGGSGGGATGGIASGLFSAFSAMPFFHTGGTVGVTQPMLQVPGITKGDESLAVLKKGEQVLTKNQQFNQQQNSGTNIVENNIILDTDSIAKSALESESGISGVMKIIRKNKDQVKNILG